jgi:hypothetical protein
MRWHATRSVLGTLVALLSIGLFAEAAQARTTVAARVFLSGGKQRLLLTISNGRQGFTTRTRPRSVTVRYTRVYRLSESTPRSPSGARQKTASWWRSAAGVDMSHLGAKRVGVTVRRLAGTVTYLVRVVPTSTIFEPAPNATRGEAAFRRIKRYFVGSRFTDCAQGWPSCTTERRYDHCAGGDLTGSWQYREFPPTATSDTQATYRVTDAFQNTGGSWGVTYELTLPSGTPAVYTWSVAPDGRASGAYGIGDDTGPLSGFRWQQPAGC